MLIKNLKYISKTCLPGYSSTKSKRKMIIEILSFGSIELDIASLNDGIEIERQGGYAFIVRNALQ